MPEPITTEPVFATASSTSTGQSAGSPTGVIPPYSMSVAAVTDSTGANDAFRASRCLRTRPFTSARVVARTMQAAYIVFPPRLPATTTQFADSVGETPYRSQNAAVSASAGSISATRTSSAPGHPRNAAATGAASRSIRDNAGTNDSTSLMPPIQPDPLPPRPHLRLAPRTSPVPLSPPMRPPAGSARPIPRLDAGRCHLVQARAQCQELQEPVVSGFRALLLVRVLASGGERRWHATGWWPAAIEPRDRPAAPCHPLCPIMPELHIETFRAMTTIVNSS